MISMTAAGTAPAPLESLARRDALRALLVPAELLQQQCRSYAERARQRNQSFEAGGDVTRFQSAEHPGADAGGVRNVRERQILAFAHTPSHGAQLTADIRRRDCRHRSRCRAFG